eukprot:1855638-Rhodomonas_salina.3
MQEEKKFEEKLKIVRETPGTRDPWYERCSNLLYCAMLVLRDRCIELAWCSEVSDTERAYGGTVASGAAVLRERLVRRLQREATARYCTPLCSYASSVVLLRELRYAPTKSAMPLRELR